MRVVGNDYVYRYPLRPTAARDAPGWEEFLVAPVDVSKIDDGDMTVTFQLENLPVEQEPRLSFSQTFALTQAPPSVAAVALKESDRPRIARQRTCPVTGGQLGSMGTPVKVLVDGQPLYLCCQGCLAKVKEHPDRYVANRSRTHARR